MSKLKPIEEEIGFDRAEINENLYILSDQERDIIKLRYGCDDCKPYTESQTAAIFGVSKDRVRQLRIRAVRKLKYQIHFQHKNLSARSNE